jgi:hypothetical protein
MTIEDFYTSAQIPFRLVNVQGEMQPVLDRRGFLHMVTFSARAAPDGAHSVRLRIPPIRSSSHLERVELD